MNASLQKIDENSKIIKLVYTLLLVYCFSIIAIETINGLMILKGINALNALIAAGKLFVSLLLFLFLSFTFQRQFLYLVIISASLFSLIFLHQLVGTDEDGRSISILFKIFNNFGIAYFLYFLVKNNQKDLVSKIITINYIMLLLNIFLGSFGIGFSNYNSADETAIGGTGLLYAGNEVGITFMLSYGSMLFLNKSKPIKLLIIITTSTIASFFILSKVALLGISLITLSLLYNHGKFIFLITTSFISVAIISTIPIWLPHFQLAINRWYFLINSYGIESFVFGGHKRLEYISEYLDKLANEPYLLVTGYGWIGEAENNFFDLIEAFGILGLVIFILFSRSIFTIIKIRQNKANTALENTCISTLKFNAILAFVVMIIAGHAVQSSLIAPFFGFFFIAHKFLKSTSEKNRCPDTL